MGRVGTRPLRKGLFVTIVMIYSVAFDSQHGHGTPCPYGCNTNVSPLAVGDGFSAKTATLLSLCDISPNRGISLTSQNVNDISIYNSGNRFIQTIRFFRSNCPSRHSTKLSFSYLNKYIIPYPKAADKT